MTTRTVMAARVGPASHHSGPRSVYVCVSDKTGPNQQELVDSVLGTNVRYGDLLLYPEHPAAAAAVIPFAERHGLFTSPMAEEQASPHLIIVIVDRQADPAFASLARDLAHQYGADIIISELPVTID